MEFNTTFANTLLTDLGAGHDSAYIRYYDAADVLLAELTFGATAFATAASGSIIANAINSESSATGGIADYVNVYASDSTSLLYNCTVSDLEGEGDVKMSSLTIGEGDMVRFGTGAYKWSLPV